MNNVEFTAICFFSLRMIHKAIQNFYKASQLITMHASVHLINKTDSLTSVTMSAIRFSFVRLQLIGWEKDTSFKEVLQNQWNPPLLAIQLKIALSKKVLKVPQIL